MSTTTPSNRRAPVSPAIPTLCTSPPDTARPASDGQQRDLLEPPSTARTRRATKRPRRGRVVAVLAASLVVLLGGTLAISAAAAPGSPAAAQPAPPPPTLTGPPTTGPSSTPDLPVPIPTGRPSVTCFPGSLQPECRTPSTVAPTSVPPPCTGEGCLPQPTTPPPPTGPGTGQPAPPGEDDDDCGITDIAACITEAINGFFRGIVEAALNPLLDLLGRTLLSTPTPDSLPRIGELWNNSWQILLACYALLILIAGVLIMAYETVQTRHSIKETAPRLVLGFLAGALSLWMATKAIQIANGLAQAIMGGGVDASAAGTTLRNLVLSSLKGGLWIILIGLVLAALLVALLISYVVRVALTAILIAGAPIAMMCHALQHTEGIAKWWWKAFGGCLAIQVCQSLALITALNVFLHPSGFTLFGPTVSGLVNLLIALALVYILLRIPFWVLASLRHGSGRSLLSGIVRAFIAYKTFGLFRFRRGTADGRSPRPSGGGPGSGDGGGGHGRVDPYARTRATRDGQYVLPLTGVRRTHASRSHGETPQPVTRRGQQARQLDLPLGEDWPENRPVLGHDGQYRLALDVERITPMPPPAIASGAGPQRGRSRQLELPFDPYKGNRPTRSGQYPLPLDGVRRTPRPPSPPPPAPPPARTRGTQMELPFDPYKGNRATRSGQYPLPLDGVRRVPPAKPAPATPPAQPAPPAAQQLRLPLDLPKPARRPSTPPPKPGGKP